SADFGSCLNIIELPVLLDLVHLDTDRRFPWPFCLRATAHVELQRRHEYTRIHPLVGTADGCLEARAEEAARATGAGGAIERFIENMDDRAVVRFEEVVGGHGEAAAGKAVLVVPAAGNHAPVEFGAGNGAAGNGNVLAVAAGRITQYDGRRQGDAFLEHEFDLGKL